MTAQIVPTGSDPHYSQVTTLEGTAYLLNFDYAQLQDCWYLSMSTIDGELLCAGLKLVCFWPLTRKVADNRMPQGDLFVFPVALDPSAPGLSDLLPNGRCTLFYIPSTDLP
jgi:hypothetical protein